MKYLSYVNRPVSHFCPMRNPFFPQGIVASWEKTLKIWYEKQVHEPMSEEVLPS